MTFVISEPYIGHLGLGIESMVTVPNIRNERAGKEPSDIPKERGFNNFPILTCLFTPQNRE